MFRWIRDCLVASRVAKLERLSGLAREMDELLAFSHLSDATRQQLQARREDIQKHARELMFG
jgi:hypothetical protein